MLKQQIQTDVKEAMKQKNQDVVEVLRMAVASINAKQTEKRYKLSKDNPGKPEEQLIKESELSDDEVIGVLTSEVKKRRDAIALYEQGNRPELAAKEKSEIEILQKYLPKQLAPEELKKMVEESIKNTGATEVKDMGKVMADVSPKTKGRADGAEVSKIVKELLGK